MKKYIFAFAIILAVIFGIGAVQYFNNPDGSSIESREELLKGIPKGSDWKIATETGMNGYIISGIYSSDGKSGIAVFEPDGEDNYKLYSREWRDNDRIIISGVYIDNIWFDLVWFNGAKTDYAEITYTIDGVRQKPVIHNAKGMEIYIGTAPAKDYSMEVIYHDLEGNSYK